MSILEELYKGNVNPSDKYIKENSEYAEINKQLTKYIDELLPLLNDEEKQLCEKIADTASNLGYISEKERFVEGFCTGAQIVLELLNYKSENFV